MSLPNQGQPLLPGDLLTAQAIWLLEVEWAGRTYRWASALPDGVPVEITDADGTAHQYRGGIDPSWASTFALFSESSAPPKLSINLWFGAEDNVPQRVADGDDLSAMTASLYRWAPGITYENRMAVFYGLSKTPNYGGVNEPVSVTFESPVYRDGGSVTSGRIEAGQLTVDSDLASGEAYPVVFGNPSSPAANADGAGSPAYPVDRSGKVAIAGVWLGTNQGTGTLYNVSGDVVEATTQSTIVDTMGREVIALTSAAAGWDADDEYAVKWSGDPIGGGDLIAECARLSTRRVDHSRMQVTRARLNAYKFSGYIDAAGTSAWDWCLRNIITLLPCSASHGPHGLYVTVWDDSATAADAKLHLTTGRGVTRPRPIQYENAEVINEVTVKYDPSWGGQYLGARTITGRIGAASAETIVSPYAVASVSRMAALDAAGPLQGVRSETIASDFIDDATTALRIATWRIRARAHRRRVITLEDTAGHLEWLLEGEHVTITDTETALAAHLAMIRSRRWVAGRFYLDLVLIES